MTQSIDFTTANDLSKFLSDKLNGNPGPAKILHWISEHQGHRNAKAMKASGQPASPSDSDMRETSNVPGQTEIQASAQTDFEGYVYLFAHDFLVDHRSDLYSAFTKKKENPDFDLEQALYAEAWDEVDSYTGHNFTNGHEWAFIAGSTAESRDRLRKELVGRGFPDRENQLSAFAYEEAVKDTIVHFLREMNRVLKTVSFKPADMAEPETSPAYGYYLKESSESCAKSWLNLSC